MSVCIRAGVAYNRHKWVQGRCVHCKADQSRFIFSHELPEGQSVPRDLEALQTTVPQSVMQDAKDCSLEELEAAAELYDRNLTDHYNKDSIKE